MRPVDDRLFQIAEAEGIYVAYRPLCPTKGLLGLYVRDSRGAAIILDSGLPANPRLERCILAEELGHHFTVPVSSVFVALPSSTRRTAHLRDEARAVRWACDYLMPAREFLDATRRGISSIEDLADHFYVTKWMVHARLRFLGLPIRRAIGQLAVLTVLGLAWLV